MSDNQSRERVAREICGEALFGCAFGCEGLCEDCYDIADWHLKEVEKATELNDSKWRKEMADEIVADRKKYESFYEARGMKKAAEEIVSRYIDDKYLLNKSKIMFDMVGIATDIITTANKTLEAEGD